MDKTVLVALVVLGCVVGCALGNSPTCGKNTQHVSRDSFLGTTLSGSAYRVNGTFGHKSTYTHPGVKMELRNEQPFHLKSLVLAVTNVKKVTIRFGKEVKYSIQVVGSEVHKVKKKQKTVVATWSNGTDPTPLNRVAVTARCKPKKECKFHFISLEACNTRFYRGCYAAKLEGDYRAVEVDDMTVDKCRNACLSRRYFHAALTGYQHEGTKADCYCISKLASSLVDESECDRSCPGDSSETCGGDSAFSVYSRY